MITVGTERGSLLVDSSPAADVQSVASSRASLASRRSVASSATNARVALEARCEKGRQLAELVAASAAASAAALVAAAASTAEATATLAAYHADERLHELAVIHERAAVRDAADSQDGVSDTWSENRGPHPDPHSFAEVDEEAGGAPSNAFRMDGDDSDGAPSQYELDGGDNVDFDDAPVIARQSAAMETEMHYEFDFVPQHDIPDILRPTPSQAPAQDNGMDFVPSFPAHDPYPVPTRAPSTGPLRRGRSPRPPQAFRFDKHDIYGSNPYGAAAVEPVVVHDAPARPPRSRSASPRRSQSGGPAPKRSLTETTLATRPPTSTQRADFATIVAPESHPAVGQASGTSSGLPGPMYRCIRPASPRPVMW